MTAASPEPLGVVPRTFVVPLDGSDFSSRAVPVTADLARRFDADLVLMTVATTLDTDGSGSLPGWLEELARTAGTPRVETVYSDARDPVDAVVALLGSHPGPVVGMATHGRGFLGTATLGGVAQQIVRAAGVPLLLVGHACVSCPTWDGPLVVCHDGSGSADAALAPALTWAGALGLPIVLVHVFHPLDVATAEAPNAAIQGALDVLGPETRAHVVRGTRPADAIHDVAEGLGASLVVMSTHGRTGLARIALGSVAMAVLRDSRCPVLVTCSPTLGD